MHFKLTEIGKEKRGIAAVGQGKSDHGGDLLPEECFFGSGQIRGGVRRKRIYLLCSDQRSIICRRKQTASQSMYPCVEINFIGIIAHSSWPRSIE